jgi:hypothetical protein
MTAEEKTAKGARTVTPGDEIGYKSYEVGLNTLNA